DGFAFCRAPPGVECRRLPAVLLERQNAKIWIFRAVLPQHSETSIDRAVVDRDHLVRPRLPTQCSRDFIEKDRDVFFLVENREDDRKVGRGHGGSLTPNARSKFCVVASATLSSEPFHNDASSSAILTTNA